VSFVNDGMQNQDTIKMVKEEQTESNIFYVSLLSQCFMLHTLYMLIVCIMSKVYNCLCYHAQSIFCQQADRKVLLYPYCACVCGVIMYTMPMYWDISVPDTS